MLRLPTLVALFAASALGQKTSQDERPSPGKPSPEELAQQLGDPGERAQAKKVLRALGAQAVPALIKVIDSPPEDDAERARATAALRILGSLRGVAVPAVPTMLDAIGTWDGKDLEPVCDALLSVWPHEQEFFSGPDPVSRMMPAIQGRGNMHRSMMSAIRRIMLIRKKGIDPRDVNEMHKALSEGDSFLREFAVANLGDHGAAAKKAVPKLGRMIAFPVPSRPAATLEKMRYESLCVAILAIDPRSKEAALAHTYRLIYHPEVVQRRAAAAALRMFGSEVSHRIATRLLAACGDPDPSVVCDALPLVGIHCGRNPEARARVRKLAAGKNPRVAALAKAALRALENSRGK